MKAKLSRNIIISLIAVTLIAGISVCTYFFTKENGNKSQAFSQSEMQIKQVNDIEKQVSESRVNNIKQEEIVVPEIETSNFARESTKNNIVNNEDVNKRIETKAKSTTKSNTKTTTETKASNTLNQEYISERVEHLEDVLVKEDYDVTWDTISLNANTSVANKNIVKDISKYTVNYIDKDTNAFIYDLKVVENVSTGTIIFANNEIIEIDGYVFVEAEKDSIIIRTDESKNILNLYYSKVPETNYKVEYYFNGVHNENIKADTTGSIPLGEEIVFEKPENIAEYQYLGYYEFNGKKNIAPVKAVNGENIIKVYYGKSNVEIKKEATAQVKAGEIIDYKITVTNKGYVSSVISVTDELKETIYIENSANIQPSITTDNKGVQTLTWNIELEAASGDNEIVTRTITFKARTAENSIGSTIKNTAILTEGEKTTSSEVTTKVKEITVKYNEFKEGRKGTDLNIIFVVDNSSSMNRPTAGKKYVKSDINKYYPVAPSDRNKTRLYDAKEAIKSFIDKQNGKKTDMRIVTFNTPSNQSTATLRVLKNKVEEKNVMYFNGEYWTRINGEAKRVVMATDGNYYTFDMKTINTGAISVGTNTVSNTNLKNAVDNITICDDQGGLGTNIVPAYKLIINNKDTYLSEAKKNVVIVLADGAFNDSYKGNKLDELKKYVDDIYTIGFGDNYNESALKEVSTEGKCYNTKNSADLLKAFDEIATEATGVEKTVTSKNGIVQLEKASDIIKITTGCPIKATYTAIENSKDVEKTLFECFDKGKLSEYGITILNDTQIVWNINEYVKNKGSIPSDVIKMVYYIPRS